MIFPTIFTSPAITGGLPVPGVTAGSTAGAAPKALALKIANIAARLKTKLKSFKISPPE
jgi:hypothetical protein